MTTFTMQDLNNLPVTKEEDEAMKELFEKMGSDLTGGKSNVFDAPIPQPSGENPHNLADIINTICTQFQLLATVIGEQARNTTPPEGANESLQETISLTLQQADWFKDMIRHELIGGGIEDLAKDAVQDIVESEVESYFENNFDPSYHFDFDDAVHDAVGDRIDDVVSDKIDDAVDAYLTNATISISK